MKVPYAVDQAGHLPLDVFPSYTLRGYLQVDLSVANLLLFQLLIKLKVIWVC